MSRDHVIAFNEAVKTNRNLQEKLKEINDKYVGQKLEPEQNDSILCNEVIPLAKTFGFEFRLGDIEAYTRELRQLEPRELTDDEIENISGGGNQICSAFAGTTDPDPDSVGYLYGLLTF